MTSLNTLDSEITIAGYDPAATAGRCTFDQNAADRAIGFFRDMLTHVKGAKAGHPFELDTWQEDIIGTLFGWRRPDGTRRYTTAYIEIPRKNGKSTLAAGLALYLLFADGEPGAEVYSAAADREQASIVFDVARQMVEADPLLKQHAQVFRKSIAVEAAAATYKVLSADAYTKHGLNAHGIIFDELHAQPNRDLWDVLTTSTGAREQPLTVAITTAGFDRHSICYEQHEYACKVRDGILEDEAYLPVIYAADVDDDWKAPAIWAKANPGLGSSIYADYLEREAGRAAELPRYENAFRRLHLNQWTEQDVRWLPMDRWDESAAPLLDLADRPCWGGLDLASTTDIAALVLVFPDDDGGYDVLPTFWIPSENADFRERRDRVPYPQWIKDGYIRATPGDVIDYDQIRLDIGDLAKTYNIRDIAVDRWNATQLVTQLDGDGIAVATFGQGYRSMSSPSKTLEALVMGRRLRHAGHPVLRWMGANTSIEQDPAGNIKPSKRRSSERIDGIVALVMAVARATASDQANAPSVYEDKGFEIL